MKLEEPLTLRKIKKRRLSVTFEILEDIDEESVRKLLDKRLVMRKTDGVSYKLKGKILTVKFPECQTYRVYHFFFIDQCLRVKILKSDGQ